MTLEEKRMVLNKATLREKIYNTIKEHNTNYHNYGKLSEMDIISTLSRIISKISE